MRKSLYIGIGVLHVVVIAVAISIGTVAAWDALIAAIGIAASFMSIAMGVFMWRIDHKLAKCVALETIADVFAAGCTTVFAFHTYYGIPVDTGLQVLLRLLILGSAVTAQVHLFNTVKHIVEHES